ncbi:MAG: GtrA family protein [Candidatus Moraniibacteriota bacterium]|jgi:putative flippase GtrA
MTETTERLNVNRKDFYLVSFIGASFALFAVPIIINLNISFIPINIFNVLLLVFFFTIFANLALGLAYLIGQKIPIVFQLAKFGAVGAFNTFLDWGVLNLLIAMTGIATGLGFSLFKGISFAIAAAGAFFWNKYWTFNSKKKSDKEEVGRFILISASGFLINVGLASLIMYLFKNSTPLTIEQLANISAATATLASLVWNFIGYKLFVFKK